MSLTHINANSTNDVGSYKEPRAHYQHRNHSENDSDQAEAMTGILRWVGRQRRRRGHLVGGRAFYAGELENLKGGQVG